MARPHSAIAVGCLLVGMADVLYLDLAAAPSLLGRGHHPSSRLVAGAGTAATPLLADRRAPARAPAAAPVEPEPIVPPRRLDPELAVTGADPERLAARVNTGARSREVGPASAAGDAAPRDEAGDDGAGDRADAAPLPDSLPSEPVQVHFPRDRSTLGAGARSRLDRLVTWLAGEPGLTATIDGHADRSGESAHNQVLSRNRAERVADYFEAAGVARRRLTVRAFGERRPFDRRPGPEAGRRNRRVEIRVSTARPSHGAP
ncbi:MAG TPA: OmpA family protein [Kofleriaceae bacterium]|nr:OmpA family protein [Kofleriaceae bacterium]